jgi:hypothetical protein
VVCMLTPCDSWALLFVLLYGAALCCALLRLCALLVQHCAKLLQLP